MLGFSPLAGATLASTGDSGNSVSVAVNNRLQIAQVNANNLIVGIGAAVGNQQPEYTLFNTLVNGRKLGDLNGATPTTVNTQDVFIAQKWDFASASLSLASASYISGPMNDYMIANFSSFGPAGIGLIFNSPTGVGTVGTGVTVETDQVIDVDNVGITATGVVGTGTTVETGQVVEVNNRQEIARTTSNLSTPIARAAAYIEPEKTLFNVDVNGRELGDIDNNGSVTVYDAIYAGQWEAGTSSAAITAYIEGPMSTYMVGNLSAYEGINIAFTTIDPTGAVNDVTVAEGAGVTVSIDNDDITATGAVGTVFIWSIIIPNQSPSFTPIAPSQTLSFAPISPAQSASFSEIAPSQTPSFNPITPTPSTAWVRIPA
tara:strand:- start:5204 stop:6322 length:1119 start_codon:yes stop_codon:yes gene_type:complete